jgi:hypothetical protein
VGVGGGGGGGGGGSQESGVRSQGVWHGLVLVTML